MKLKTMKDIKSDNVFAPFPNKLSIEPAIIIDYRERIKQEAIKDIKEIKKNGFWEDYTKNVIHIERRGARIDVIRYIKWKNNITEEDLK